MSIPILTFWHWAVHVHCREFSEFLVFWLMFKCVKPFVCCPGSRPIRSSLSSNEKRDRSPRFHPALFPIRYSTCYQHREPGDAQQSEISHSWGGRASPSSPDFDWDSYKQSFRFELQSALGGAIVDLIKCNTLVYWTHLDCFTIHLNSLKITEIFRLFY